MTHDEACLTRDPDADDRDCTCLTADYQRGRLDGIRLALATVDTGGRAAKQLEELLHTLEGVRA